MPEEEEDTDGVLFRPYKTRLFLLKTPLVSSFEEDTNGVLFRPYLQAQDTLDEALVIACACNYALRVCVLVTHGLH